MSTFLDVLLPTRGAIYRMLLLALLGLLAIAVEAAPIGLDPHALPSPDLLALLVAVMAVRRPDSVAIPLICALGIMRDLLTDIPAGAGALGLIALSEALRTLSQPLSRGSLLREWIAVSAILFAMAAIQYILVLLTFSQPPYLLALARQWALTAAAWPLVFLLLRWLIGIRAAPTEGRERSHAG